MPFQPAKPAILISRLLPEAGRRLARSRAEIDAYAVDGAMPGRSCWRDWRASRA